MKKSSCVWVVVGVVGVIVLFGIILNAIFPRQRVYTEAQINAAFDQAIANSQDADNKNRMTDINITLEKDIAHITGSWQDGQQLTGEIIVSTDGTKLRSQNIVITNISPLVQTLYQNIADTVIQAGLDNVVARQGQFKQAKIEPGKIVVIYR